MKRQQGRGVRRAGGCAAALLACLGVMGAQQPGATTRVEASGAAAGAASGSAGLGPELDDAERGQWQVTEYAFDLHLKPETNGFAARTLVVLRNTGSQARSRVPLQISSALHWESVSVRTPATGGYVAAGFTQHRLETDADSTGAADEAIVTLPTAVEPGGSVNLDLFYSGALPASGARLEHIGASPAAAEFADWDSVGGQPPGLLVALRGFGSVLWAPVASPQLFLGDGDRLFAAVERARRRNAGVRVSLRLAMEYDGAAPVGAYFCGRSAEFTAHADDQTNAAGVGRGVALASFAAEPLGVEELSLFATDRAAQPEGPELSTAEGAPLPLMEVVTADTGSLPRLSDAAQSVERTLQPWLGAHPRSWLTVIDHAGQPVDEGALLVAPISGLAGSDGLGALAHSLTHAWVQTGQPWIDEGVGQFSTLLWIEQQHGREAAAAQLEEWMRPVALAEPPPAAKGAALAEGQPLVTASDPLYYRRKAAAVWWMLRDLVGDEALAQTLTWLSTQSLAGDPRAAAERVEARLEAAGAAQSTTSEGAGAGTKGGPGSLAWFFQDWVLADHGLPDLSLGEVSSHALPVGSTGRSGWLVSVTVQNQGAAAAQVPLIVRTASSSTTRLLHVPAQASVTERILLESPAVEVRLNDGDVPETVVSTHVRQLTAGAPPV